MSDILAIRELLNFHGNRCQFQSWPYGPHIKSHTIRLISNFDLKSTQVYSCINSFWNWKLIAIPFNEKSINHCVSCFEGPYGANHQSFWGVVLFFSFFFFFNSFWNWKLIAIPFNEKSINHCVSCFEGPYGANHQSFWGVVLFFFFLFFL